MSKRPNKAAQYRLANEKFLQQKAAEEGVTALESGILMRCLEHPVLRDRAFEDSVGESDAHYAWMSNWKFTFDGHMPCAAF